MTQWKKFIVIKNLTVNDYLFYLMKLKINTIKNPQLLYCIVMRSIMFILLLLVR